MVECLHPCSDEQALGDLKLRFTSIYKQDALAGIASLSGGGRAELDSALPDFY